jgi:hypothetical protein
VVVVSGDTEIDPLKATVPMPWLMEAETAFAVVHDKVEDPPFTMEVGAAAKLVQMGATDGGGAVTTTLLLQVTEVAPALKWLTACKR